jgi:hypothetical protein
VTYCVVELAAEAGWHKERKESSHIQRQRPESRELRLGAMADVREALMESVREQALVAITVAPEPVTQPRRDYSS